MAQGTSNAPKEKSFFGGVAVLTIGIMVVKLIGMFYKIPLGNIIGEQGNADFSNAYSIYAVLVTISTAGLPVAVSKMISEATTLNNEAQVQRIFAVSLKFFLFMGSISFIVMFFFPEQLAGFMRNSHAAAGIQALAPAVVFVSGVAAFRGYFQGREIMAPTAISQIIEAVSKLVLGLTLAYYIMNRAYTEVELLQYEKDIDLSVLSPEEIQGAIDSLQSSQAAAGAICGVTVGTALALAFLFTRYLMGGGAYRTRRGDVVDSEKTIMKTLLATAIPITLTSSMAGILNVLDSSLVQGQLQDALGFTENESRTVYGNYAFAVNIYNLPISLVTAVTVSVIPAVSGALASKQRKKASSIAISALRVTGLLAIPMGMGLFFMGEPIMALLYPASDVALAGKLLSNLGIVSAFVCIALVSTSILQVYGFTHLPILITVLGGLIKIITNFVLVGNPNVGIYGATIGNLLCFTFTFSASFFVLCRIVPQLAENKFMFVKPTIASGVMGLGAWATHGLCTKFFTSVGLFLETVDMIEGQEVLEEVTEQVLSRTGGGIATLLAIFVAAIIYVVLIFTLGAVTEEDVLMMPKGATLAKYLPVDKSKSRQRRKELEEEQKADE